MSDGIHVQGLTVAYRNGHTALRDASFDVPRGSIAALVGVNGAGKSTLFKAIMGFLPAAAGGIEILGQPVAQVLKDQGVAYVPQAEEVDWTFPVLVEDVVMMGRYGHMGFFRRPRAADHEAVAQALARVNMTEFRHRQIGELSGGQKQMLSIARAMAEERQLYLIDEPTKGLAPAIISTMARALKDLKDQGASILLVEQNFAVARALGDSAHVMDDGRVIWSGKMAELAQDAALQERLMGLSLEAT